MTTVRLYGITEGFGSYAQVLRGFDEAFREYGYGPDRLVTVPIDGRNPDEQRGLPEADVGIFLGPPSAASALGQNARHSRRFVMVAPNSDRLPEAMMKIVNRYATDVLVPSVWAAGVVASYSEHSVIVVPHGVFRAFEHSKVTFGPVSLETQYDMKIFKALHLSSSSRERKGTMKLVKAWARLRTLGVLPEKAALALVLVPETRVQVIEWLVEQKIDYKAFGIHLHNRLGPSSDGAHPGELWRIYNDTHVLCQPSRAEAFGMTPCEALACGTPVIATMATGHSQWFSSGLPGAVPVKVGPSDEIDDLPGARAPRLRSKWIGEALEFAYQEWPKLRSVAVGNAAAFRQEWSWANQLQDFRDYIEKGSDT